MQHPIAAIVVTALLAWSSAAVAQDINRRQSLCTIDSAFGQRFGEPIAGGGSGHADTHAVRLPNAFAPFEQAEVLVTRSSQRVYGVTGLARFADSASARAAFERELAALRTDGSFSVNRTTTLHEGAIFYSDSPDQLTGLTAEIWIEDRQVAYSCMNGALSEAAFDERLSGATP